MVNANQVHQDLKDVWEKGGYDEITSHQLLKRCIVYKNIKPAIEGTFATAILTEWDEFKEYDWDAMGVLMQHPPLLFDGRNIIESDQLNSNYIFKSIGK